MSPVSPRTPSKELPLSSPTWDCLITATEPFNPTKDGANPIYPSTKRMSSNCMLGLRNRNQLSTKACNSADQTVLGVAEVVTYEHVGKPGAERAVQHAKAVEASKEAKNVTRAALHAEVAVTGMKTRGRKRKTAALRAELAVLQAKTVRTREVQDVADAERDVRAPGPSAKVAKMSNGLALPLSTESLAERGTRLDLWRAPVARIW